MNVTDKNAYYDALDGVRAYSAIGIVMMHVLANGKYVLSGFLFETVVPSFTNLVFLFMIISAFSMCCGYYEKVLQNKVSFEDFYKKRFLKILPFFGLLSLLDVILSPSKESFMELFANLTLCFGFLPNAGNISVIGVGWFLGVIFVFYLIFPFYCCLLGSKRRAWIVLILTYMFNLLCAGYFEIRRTNILYDAVYLVLGGLIYLYRDNLSEFSEHHRMITGGLVIISTIAYYTVGVELLVNLGLYGSIVLYAIGTRHNGLLLNSCTRFMSTISLEIYLCHMVCFRIIERLGLSKCFANDIVSFLMATVLTLIGAIIFAVVAQFGFAKIGNALSKVYVIYNKSK